MINFVVHVSNDALMEMTLATLEGLVVPKAAAATAAVHQGVETYGLLWGHELVLPDNDILYSVEKMSVDSMARRRNGSVLPSDGLRLAKDVITSYWPKYSLLGNFHSHPYGSLGEVQEVNGHEFSDGDYAHMSYLKNLDNDFRIGLVMTVAPLGKLVLKEPEVVAQNIICWDFSNYRFWLNASVIRNIEPTQDKKPDLLFLPPSAKEGKQLAIKHGLNEVILHVPFLDKPWAAKEFGRRNRSGTHTPAVA